MTRAALAILLCATALRAQEERAPGSTGTAPFIAEPPTPARVQPAPAEPAPLLPPSPTVAAPTAPGETRPLPAPSRDLRSVSFHALLGGWAKSRSDGSGRFWDVAWGVRAGYAFLEGRLEAELQAVRAGSTAGNPFVNTNATHNLIAVRAFWVLGDRYAALLGGGGGVALAQTHYALQDVGGAAAANLDAIAVKPVMEITVASRARVFRGLEARGEVSTLLRDGRIEILPIFGLGAAF